MKEKWNDIVKIYKDNKNLPEEKFQVLWELIFAEHFGYSRLNGDIDVHRKMHIGSMDRVVPDLILRKNSKDLFLVELKRPNFSISDAYEQQLFSYLKQIKCDIGILVCDKIYIYHYDYLKDDKEQLNYSIEIKEDNNDGVKFLELFSKESFLRENIIQFIWKKNEENLKLKEVQQQLTEDFVNNIVFNYFSKLYGEEVVTKAMLGYKIEVKKSIIKDPRSSIGPRPAPQPSPTPSARLGAEMATDILRQKGYDAHNRNTTYACYGPRYNAYPSNVASYRFSQTLYFALDDNQAKKCYFFKIPAGTFSVDDFYVRKDRDMAVIYNTYNDPGFTDRHSGIPFKDFLIFECEY